MIVCMSLINFGSSIELVIDCKRIQETIFFFLIRMLGTNSFSRTVFLSGLIVTSALIIWKALMCITGSESPVVVVLSGSMEPGFKRVSLFCNF